VTVDADNGELVFERTRVGTEEPAPV
jgi:hypothetical protein